MAQLVIPALWRLRQEGDSMCQASLNYGVRPCLENGETKMTTPQGTEQRSRGPPYVQVLHLQIQPTSDQKYSEKQSYICTEHIQAFNFYHYSLNNTI